MPPAPGWQGRPQERPGRVPPGASEASEPRHCLSAPHSWRAGKELCNGRDAASSVSAQALSNWGCDHVIATKQYREVLLSSRLVEYRLQTE